jgi:hypothetical protein
MVSDWVTRHGRLRLVLACCLSLACDGKITSPDGQATAPNQRDIDDTDDEPEPGDMLPDTTPMDEDPPPAGKNGEMDCDASAVAGLSVTIGSPDFECDAFRVIVTAAGFEEELSCSVREDRCRCFGVHERPGTYTVTVETGDPPVELAEREVEVVMDEANCHVETESVSVRVVAPGGAEDAGAVDAGGGDPDPPVEDAGL